MYLIIFILILILIWINFIHKIFKKHVFDYIKFYKTLTKEQKEKYVFTMRNDIEKIENNKFWMVLKGSFLIPIRISFFLFIATIGFIILKILCKVYKIEDLEKEQNEKFKYYSRKIIRIVLQWFIYAQGFKINYKIHKTNNPSNENDRKNCKIIVSNHVSWIDIMQYLTFETIPGFLSNHLIKEMPIIGFYSKVIQTIFVNRSDKNDLKNAFTKLNERIENYKNNKNFNPILIFPEGTTSNSNILLPYKKGAFIFDLPIKMIVLDYRKNEINPEFTLFDQFGSYLVTSCNFINYLTVYEIDKLLYPSDYKDEKGEIDWKKMSNHCRNIMAESSNFKLFESEDIYKLLQEFKELKKIEINLKNKKE